VAIRWRTVVEYRGFVQDEPFKRVLYEMTLLAATEEQWAAFLSFAQHRDSRFAARFLLTLTQISADERDWLQAQVDR